VAEVVLMKVQQDLELAVLVAEEMLDLVELEEMVLLTQAVAVALVVQVELADLEVLE
jgi:hypothetical protein